ncbi:MAG: hypothetical protein K9H49_17335 [Bacteroidales bacterium]|nr:hypothetical protein [Bacteroidales bacterium]MCF8391300.1 hypothetical protein [Bacteroidales bacterium]
MKIKHIISGLIAGLFILYSCSEYPIDDDGLLITTQEKCYIGSIYLYGTDNIDCLIQDSTLIDTINLTVNGLVKFGTNLKYLKPAASLSIDSKITPAMGVWTDFSLPRNYTVISGNRKVIKEYTITIRVEGE